MSMIKFLAFCVAIALQCSDAGGNSAPEQSLQAKEYLATAQARAGQSRPTRTIADQPTITLHEVWMH